MTSRTDLHRDLAAVAAALEEARIQVEGGAPLDLGGLDARVGQLCTAAAGLPGAQAKGLLPALEALVGKLDGLAGALARQQDLLRDAAEGRTDAPTARQRAAAAYGRTGPADPGPHSAAPPAPPRPSTEEPT